MSILLLVKYYVVVVIVVVVAVVVSSLSIGDDCFLVAEGLKLNLPDSRMNSNISTIVFCELSRSSRSFIVKVSFG